MHRLSPEAESDLDAVWYYAATESGSIETADRLVEAVRVSGRWGTTTSVARATIGTSRAQSTSGPTSGRCEAGHE